MGFHENLTDHQACASIEYLYWHDELEECLKKLQKHHRLEMPLCKKNEVFYSTHQDTIDVQSIAEPTSVYVVGVNSDDCSRVPSDHLFARWRIDLYKREFLSIINETKVKSTKRILRDSANKTDLQSSHRASRREPGRENSTPITLVPKRKPRPRNKFSPRVLLTRTPKASTVTTPGPVAKPRHAVSPKSSIENWSGVEFVTTHPKDNMSFSSYKELAAGMNLSPVTPKQFVDTVSVNNRTPELKAGVEPDGDGSACKRRLNLDSSDVLDMVCGEEEEGGIVIDSEDDCMVTDGGDEGLITRDILTTTVEARREGVSSEKTSSKERVAKKVADRNQR